MNTFRTVVNPETSGSLITLKHRVLTLGSCFSDAIGRRLSEVKIDTKVNPMGVIYNPISLHKAVQYCLMKKTLTQATFIQNQDIHLNYDFHSSFSSLSQNDLQKEIQYVLDSTHEFLKTADWIILTYGTAWVYEHNGQIVANCHKMPGNLFTKKLLNLDAITTSFESLYVMLKEFNPDLKIILTVSPVRHIKDSLPLNTVSKSLLRLACHQCAERFKDVEYFPSYEIMMDDLRDYRFYKPDMIHPTEQAEDYIWEKFIESNLTIEAKKFVFQWKSIQTALQHKPFHVQSRGHQNFLKQTIHKLEQLSDIVNVDEEIAALKAQLFA